MFSKEQLEQGLQIPLTYSAVGVFAGAEIEARKIGGINIDSGRLLLGYVGVANRTFFKILSLDPQQVRKAVDDLLPSYYGNLTPDRSWGFTPRARSVVIHSINIAVKEAEGRRAGLALDADHIMMGFIEDGENLAISAFQSLGVAPTRLQFALSEVRE